jgi:transposase
VDGTPIMTRALDPEVVDALFDTIAPLLPAADQSHPLGCHRPRISDRLCLRGILIRLVTGSSWVDIEAILEYQVSDTTLRRRRDQWISAGVFASLLIESTAAFDRVVGLDLSEVSLDGSTHKAPCGGEGTGKSPVDRGKLGWKWSVATDRNGIPIGWAIDGANRNDIKLLGPTLGSISDAGLLADIDTLHLDRGYDYPVIERRLTQLGIDDAVIAKRRKQGEPPPPRQTLGMRWVVEGTNSWWSNYGQLRRSTDRRNHHRHAALILATAVIITGKLIDHRNRWHHASAPID